jgi:hypothetical protein
LVFLRSGSLFQEELGGPIPSRYQDVRPHSVGGLIQHDDIGAGIEYGQNFADRNWLSVRVSSIRGDGL